MKKNSVVWNFFDRVENQGRCVGVICQLCEIEYRFFGNTTNLRVHLSRKHPIQWELANKNKAELGETKTRSNSVVYQIQDEVKNPISILDDDEGATAAALIDNLEKRTSDEEWLEDLYETVEFKPKPKKMKIKRRIKREVEDSDNDGLTKLYLRSPSKQDSYNNSMLPEKTSDEFSAFGDYVANKIRNMKTPRTRGNIQQIITTVLWQAEYGTYDEADSVRNLFLSFSTTTNQTPASTNRLDNQTPIEVIVSDTNEVVDNSQSY